MSHRPPSRPRRTPRGPRRARPLIAALALLALAPAARADGPGPGDDLLLGDIPSVTTASKYDQKVSDAPSSVSVITADEIALYGYRTIDDILRSVRGLYVSDDLNYSHVGVRGMSRPGDWSSLVLVLVDGHRTNEPLYDSPPFGRAMPVDIQLIDRVEVIRGATSSLYGTNALSAVINVITKRGRDLDGVKLGVEAQSDGAYLVRLAGGTRQDGGLEIAAGAAAHHAAGHDLYFPELGHARDLDGVDDFNADLKVAWRQLTLVTDVGYARSDMATAPYGSVFGRKGTHTSDLYYFAELQYADHVAAGFDLTARALFDHHRYAGDYLYDVSEAGDGSSIIVNHDLGRSETLSAEVQGDIQLAPGLHLTLGGEVRHALALVQKNWDEAVYLDDRRSPTVAGAFVQGEWQMVPALTLEAALRVDGDESGPVLSPRVALVARPGDATTLKLLVAHAFRAPNQYELHYRDPIQKPPSDLEPEQITNYEVIWEQRISTPLRAMFSAFHWAMSDLVTPTTDAADGLLTFVNRDTAAGWGLEAQLDANWTHGYSASLSYSFVDARDGADAWLANSPRHMLKLQAGLPLIGEKLAVGLECQLMSRRKRLVGGESDAVALVNLSLSSQGLVRGLRLSATAFNLLDQAYGDPASDVFVQAELPQARLRVSFTATYSF
ncbi:MAG: TonB-dependent receptor [Myxococcota bacterium]